MPHVLGLPKPIVPGSEHPFWQAGPTETTVGNPDPAVLLRRVTCDRIRCPGGLFTQ